MYRERTFGTLGWRTTLSREDIAMIRDAVKLRDYHKAEALKLSNAALAQKFEVSATTISAVINHYYTYLSAR